MILALASVVNYDRQSDVPIWSVTSSGVNYDRNKFIVQATDARKNISSFEIKMLAVYGPHCWFWHKAKKQFFDQIWCFLQ